MRRSKASERSIVWLLLAALAGACFGGSFVQGLPCESDEDCGPELSCVEGFCGGLGDPGLCGNGLRDVGEACDDGNAAEGDGCTPTCRLPVCGDGFLAPGEECDDGNNDDRDGCSGDCQDVCGDGIVGESEECDDGNTDDRDICTPVCQEPRCGDGYLAATEWCDDGNTAEGDGCTPVCSLPVCGDGYDAPGEACDDGNRLDTDGCTNACALATCGDGHAQEGVEECDGDDLLGGRCDGLGFSGGEIECEDDCTFDTTGCFGIPVLELSFSQVKRFDFSWAEVQGAQYYQLEESTAPGEPFKPLGGEIVETSVSYEMPLHLNWGQVSYRLSACNRMGYCMESAVVGVMNSLVEAVGYVKASNTGSGDFFGGSVALSGDGNTLAVGAIWESSSATGIDSLQDNDSAYRAGAVYVFVHDGAGAWSQQAYVKASNTGSGDFFGVSVALSGDGNTLAVGAWGEDSSATGIEGPQDDDSALSAGAVYVFVRDGEAWSQQAYVKASNTDWGDRFGVSVALSADGNTLAVGASYEDSSATGIDGPQYDDSASDAGAMYVFVREGETWSQQAYAKASNTGWGDHFGESVALSGDGNILAVGAWGEDSNATGINGDQYGAFDDDDDDDDHGDDDAGAVYVFVRGGMGSWSQSDYVKASNSDRVDLFGVTVELSRDGNTLVVGASGESSLDSGVEGIQDNDSAPSSGAVYVFVRDGMGSWSQQAYIKASNTDPNDQFGDGMALSEDGNVLAVGAGREDGNATGIGNEQDNNYISSGDSGATYVFARDGAGNWSQQAYVKAPNTGENDRFGVSVALSGDGNVLAIGASGEASGATGIGGLVGAEQSNDSNLGAGAVYLY